MADREHVFRTVVEVMKRTFKAPDLTVTEATTANDVDGWDSVNHGLLLARLEKQFQVKIPDRVAYEAKNVSELVDGVVTLVGRAELANTVILGTGEWLFHRDHGVVEQLSGIRAFTARELQRWRYLLEARGHWLEARGARYYLFITPEKHVVYGDKLVEPIEISSERPASQLLATFQGAGAERGVHVVYPLAALKNARATRETYFATDTHWNMFGGYIGYRALCERINADVSVPVLDEQDLEYYSRNLEGDLGVRLTPERSAEGLYLAVKAPRSRLVGENRVFTRGSILVFENHDRSLPRAVIFRDSFANWLLPLLSESFSRIVAVSSMELYHDLVEAERPQVVITEIAERFLNFPFGTNGEGYFPDDFAAPPFEALCGMTPADIGGFCLTAG